MVDGEENRQQQDVAEGSRQQQDVDDAEKWCAVCGAKSSGYHYGAYSCEGCKSFFKRTIQRNLKEKYECVTDADEQCEVDTKTRANCQFCRFRKCLAVGMVEEGVRKVKKRGGRSFYPLKKGKKDQETQTSTSPDTEQENSNPNLLITQENVECPATAETCSGSNLEEETCIEYCSELIQQLMATNPCIVPPGEPLSLRDNSHLEAGKEGLLTRLSNAITKELHIIVEWSKLVPGFGNLQRQDQIALLMAAGMELIVFRVIFRSVPFEEHIFMNNTTCLPREDCYYVLNQEIVDMILDVVNRIRPLHVDKVEFACMEAILLLDPETPGLSGKLPVEALQGSYMSALKSHVESQYPEQPGRFAKLLLRLPALRDVCTKGFEYFLLVRANLEGEIPMSTLLQEMFESPRI